MAGENENEPPPQADDTQAEEQIFSPSAIVNRAKRATGKVKYALGQVTKDLHEVEKIVHHLNGAQRSAERQEAALAAGKRARGDDSMGEGDEAASPSPKRPAAASEADGTSAPTAADAPVAMDAPPVTEGGEAKMAETALAAAAAGSGDGDGDHTGANGGGSGEGDGSDRSAAGNDAAQKPKASPRARRGPTSWSHVVVSRVERSGSLDGASKERNRKMFGMLMGTLRRAREEVKSSEQGAVQQMKLQKVDEKIRSDRTRAIESQKASVATRLANETQRRELLIAERSALKERESRLIALTHEASLASFLRTETSPPLYYLPKNHNAATTERLAQQQGTVLEPMGAQLDELEIMPTRTPRSHDWAGGEANEQGKADSAGDSASAAAAAGLQEEADEPAIPIEDDDAEGALDSIMAGSS